MKVVFLLSPAKTLNFDRIWVEDDSLECRDETLFPEETGVLLDKLRSFSKGQLKDLYKASDKIAGLNKERFDGFEALPSLPAALAFDGDAYQTLRSFDMSKAELEWLNDHLRILSGFYGLISPLDK